MRKHHHDHHEEEAHRTRDAIGPFSGPGSCRLACSSTWRRSCHDRCMSFQCQPTATQKTPTRTAMADTPSPYDVPGLADGAHDAPEVTRPHLSVKPGRARLVYRWGEKADRDRAGGARRDQLVRPDHDDRGRRLGRRLPAHRSGGDPGRAGPAGRGPARAGHCGRSRPGRRIRTGITCCGRVHLGRAPGTRRPPRRRSPGPSGSSWPATRSGPRPGMTSCCSAGSRR